MHKVPLSLIASEKTDIMQIDSSAVWKHVFDANVFEIQNLLLGLSSFSMNAKTLDASLIVSTKYKKQEKHFAPREQLRNLKWHSKKNRLRRKLRY